jgi:NAD-dependent DNA ligase
VDWRFLAAFGITRLGMGNCENLLRSCLLSDIFVLNLEKIADIEGFAELTAQAVVTGNFRWFYRQNPSWLNRYESVHKFLKFYEYRFHKVF